VPEGTVVAIPVEPKGWVLGVYARVKKGRGSGGVPFGYFFGKVFDQLPDKSVIESLKAKDAILQSKFGDLGLIQGRWKIIGECKPWIRIDWPVPDMMYASDEIFPYDQLIRYDENNMSHEIFRENFPPGSLNLPKASMPGSRALEIIISMIIRGERPPSNTLRKTSKH
jgi:hypothetical protein